MRGGKGVAFVRDYLDRHFPLTLGTHRHARRKKRSFAYGVWPTARRQFIPAALMAAPDGVENAVFSTLARRTSAFFACVKEALKNWS